ncbi:MAG: DNA methylase, partial [Chitinophagaceae bacterium]|nr:DNA methylase [Chitinophagaceae bacterium]
TAPADNANRALAYLGEEDLAMVSRHSARVVSTISTTSQPTHETIVLLAAQTNSGNRYVYKLCSNTAELKPSANWMSGVSLQSALQQLSEELRHYNYQYIYKGDQTLEAFFKLQRDGSRLITDAKPHYKEGMLLVHGDAINRIQHIDISSGQAELQSLSLSENRTGFLKQYIHLRDNYLQLAADPENESLRSALRQSYEEFTGRHGMLNHPVNKKLIQEDEAFAFTILSSLERRDGDNFLRSDILSESLQPKETDFHTDDPIEALARSLNDKGNVDIGFIESATGLSDTEVIQGLEHHIYLNPVTRQWETADQYLSGKVVEKFSAVQKIAEAEPENPYIRQSLEAIQKVQPERIPFELLDFNLGERWLPGSYYDRFASEIFETDT